MKISIKSTSKKYKMQLNISELECTSYTEQSSQSDCNI